jgi:hypothetical protein
MYSLRIQVLVLVAAYYEQALEDRISGAWCPVTDGGRRGGLDEKVHTRLSP